MWTCDMLKTMDIYIFHFDVLRIFRVFIYWAGITQPLHLYIKCTVHRFILHSSSGGAGSHHSHVMAGSWQGQLLWTRSHSSELSVEPTRTWKEETEQEFQPGGNTHTHAQSGHSLDRKAATKLATGGF